MVKTILRSNYVVESIFTFVPLLFKIFWCINDIRYILRSSFLVIFFFYFTLRSFTSRIYFSLQFVRSIVLCLQKTNKRQLITYSTCFVNIDVSYFINYSIVYTYMYVSNDSKQSDSSLKCHILAISKTTFFSKIFFED